MKQKILIGVGIFAVLVASVVTSVLLANYLVDTKISTGAVPAVSEDDAEKAAPAGPPIYVPLDPFVVNYVQDGAIRYLQITMELMSREDEIIEQTKNSVPEIRNAMILILSDSSYTELATREGKNMIRQQAQDEVNRIIDREEGIEAVFLTGFVMQ